MPSPSKPKRSELGTDRWQLVDRRGGVVHNPDQRIFDTLVGSLVGVLDNRLAAVRDRDEELTAAASVDRWALREHRRRLGHVAVKVSVVRRPLQSQAPGERDRAVVWVAWRLGVGVRAADDDDAQCRDRSRPRWPCRRPNRSSSSCGADARWGLSTAPENWDGRLRVDRVSVRASAGTAISASATKAPTSPAAKRRKQRFITLMKCTPMVSPVVPMSRSPDPSAPPPYTRNDKRASSGRRLWVALRTSSSSTRRTSRSCAGLPARTVGSRAIGQNTRRGGAAKRSASASRAGSCPGS